MPIDQECYAVIFTGTRSANTEGYDEASIAMFQLATQQNGFISIEHSQMGENTITISYWDSLQAIQDWKDHPEHKVVQEMGQSTWYKKYQIKIAKVLREYDFEN